MTSSLKYVDGLAVAYLVGTGMVLLAGSFISWVYLFSAGLHVVGVAAIVAVRRARSPSPLLRAVREMYPLLLLLILYGEVDLFVRLFHEPPGFDAFLSTWDQWLFGGHPHLYLDQWLDGPVWTELFHLLYLSYFLLLIGAFLFVRRAHPGSYGRFAFVVTGMFVSFIAAFVAFPVAGPLVEPHISLNTSGVFPRIVSWVYAPLTLNGIHAGAFPSSHVGMSVGIALFLAPRRWWGRMGLGVLVLGIAASTVYGRFHYAIDAVAGLVAGVVLYVVWMQIYTFLESRQRTHPDPQEAKRHVEPVASPVAREQ